MRSCSPLNLLPSILPHNNCHREYRLCLRNHMIHLNWDGTWGSHVLAPQLLYKQTHTDYLNLSINDILSFLFPETWPLIGSGNARSLPQFSVDLLSKSIILLMMTSSSNFQFLFFFIQCWNLKNSNNNCFISLYQ